MNLQVIRATETWQQAGAYYARIQGMAKQHSITLRREFDEHDAPDTKYIVLTDEGFPIATCRFYQSLGYTITDHHIVHGDTFDCIRMEKKLMPTNRDE